MYDIVYWCITTYTSLERQMTHHLIVSTIYANDSASPQCRFNKYMNRLDESAVELFVCSKWGCFFLLHHEFILPGDIAQLFSLSCIY
jgi:hypothetical protein